MNGSLRPMSTEEKTPRALHPKADFWVGRGIFDDLTSFRVLESRINELPLEKDRGDVFEIFIEAYLQTQPITQCAQHWVVGSIPLDVRQKYKLPSDGTGIDGIYQTYDGEYVAYQVKYRQASHLTLTEVATFLATADQFADKVIFTTATTLKDVAADRSRFINGLTFRELSSGALEKINAWLRSKPEPITRAQPDPRYQTQALSDIEATLADHDRATVVMACGTGKTFVSLWAVEQEKPKTVLVLLPSLSLLKQTLKEWSEHTSWSGRFSYICVCSDKTVGLANDGLNEDPSEVGFRVDTDPDTVRRYLKEPSDRVKVVFSTYQSSPVVGEGCAGLPPFDIGVFDEAHKTVGLAKSTFGYALSDQNIAIRKRLFFTATPRHYNTRKRDKDGDIKFE